MSRPHSPTTSSQVMQCMEVWGGNRAVDTGVVMSGLDAWAYSRPWRGESGGGDVHYVSSCATGRITRLLVADVSGHGEAVAATASELRRLMRRYVNHLDQSRFIRALNRAFGRLANDGSFATAVAATFFTTTRTLSISNAGHPPPLLFSSRAKRWVILGTREQPEREVGAIHNTPLGIITATDYDRTDLRLRIGDLVLCYTDSLIESRSADGNVLGVDGLLALVRSLEIGDPSTFIARLLNAIGSLHPANLTEDDVTVLLFRPNGLAARVPLRTRAATPFRMMHAFLKSLISPGTPMPWPEISMATLGGGRFDPLIRTARDTGTFAADERTEEAAAPDSDAAPSR